MENVLLVILLAFGIFQVMLLFKLWNMTDNVRDIANDLRQIKNKLNTNTAKNTQSLSKNEDNTKHIDFPIDSKIKQDSLVIHVKKDTLMRVKYFTNENKYGCFSDEGKKFEGEFSDTEIKLFGK